MSPTDQLKEEHEAIFGALPPGKAFLILSLIRPFPA